MSKKKVLDYVNTLSTEEQVKFKDLITETLARADEIEKNTASSKAALTQTVENLKIIESELNHMSTVLSQTLDQLNEIWLKIIPPAKLKS